MYNHRSCDSRAVAVIYGFYSVLGTSMIKDFSLSNASKDILGNNRWSIKIFIDNLHNYLYEYNKKIKPEDNWKNGWINIMAALEHNRWNIMMMSEGYTGVLQADQCNEDIKKIIMDWTMHSILNKDDEQNGKIDLRDNKLHIAKIHFAIRPFDELGDRIGLDTFYYLSQKSEGVLKLKIQNGKIRDNLAMDEIDRIRKGMSVENYKQLIYIANDYVTLSKENFKKKWGTIQTSLGIDKFELLMDKIGTKIVGFKTTKNRQYDRQYVSDVAKSLERILNKNIIRKSNKEKNKNVQLDASSQFIIDNRGGH